ncbi:ABC-2 transporter permease [Clostridium sp. MSJ-11]|uniref:ABC-2 transporter permease n=1 Tax=Clostridium mobile TaxID=2841512 RepID=A0ABS6EKB1_9CLOT|nr:ABC-2 transporter permease [Clostridium mobile]MBU5485646.1 ABC-2 transporter permease [Clostridium mobile]
MLNLIIKDILLQRKISFVTIPYSLIMIIVGIFAGTSNILPLYTLGIIITVYLSVQYIVGYEEKNKSSLVIVSLPINRDDIVISKYLSSLLIMIINISIFLIPFFLLNVFFTAQPVEFIDYAIMLICISIILLTYSVYFPLYFKFGYAVVRIFPFFVYIGGLMLPGFLQKLIEKNNPIMKNILNIMASNPAKFLTIFLLFSLTTLLISLLLSLSVYKNRDL